MFVYDVDGDGDADVVSSSAHDYGLWWHEQIRDPGGRVTWRTHTIDDRVSQTHALAVTDLNGDGIPDLVTGKRFFAHNGNDPASSSRRFCSGTKAAGTRTGVPPGRRT
jgi:hypothetical protein